MRRNIHTNNRVAKNRRSPPITTTVPKEPVRTLVLQPREDIAQPTSTDAQTFYKTAPGPSGEAKIFKNYEAPLSWWQQNPGKTQAGIELGSIALKSGAPTARDYLMSTETGKATAQTGAKWAKAGYDAASPYATSAYNAGAKGAAHVATNYVVPAATTAYNAGIAGTTALMALPGGAVIVPGAAILAGTALGLYGAYKSYKYAEEQLTKGAKATAADRAWDDGKKAARAIEDRAELVKKYRERTGTGLHNKKLYLL
jgi:hypothetical protein